MLNSNEPYLEMAIQTVLYQYKNKLIAASGQEHEKLMKIMAAEINSKALQFKKITDQTLEKFEELT